MMSYSFNESEENNLTADNRREVNEMRKKKYGSMSAEQKWEIAAELYFSALAFKRAHLKRIHPEWPEQEIEQRAREWMMYAKT